MGDWGVVVLTMVLVSFCLWRAVAALPRKKWVVLSDDGLVDGFCLYTAQQVWISGASEPERFAVVWGKRGYMAVYRLTGEEMRDRGLEGQLCDFEQARLAAAYAAAVKERLSRVKGYPDRP